MSTILQQYKYPKKQIFGTNYNLIVINFGRDFKHLILKTYK